jgi:hypothetical protein
LWHFDGSSWTKRSDLKVLHLRAFGPEDVWALSMNETLYQLHHFDRSEWTEVRQLSRASYFIARYPARVPPTFGSWEDTERNDRWTRRAAGSLRFTGVCRYWLRGLDLSDCLRGNGRRFTW